MFFRSRENQHLPQLPCPTARVRLLQVNGWVIGGAAEGPQEPKQVVQLVMTGSVCGNSMCAGDSQGEPILARAGQTHSHMALAQLYSLSYTKLREPSFQNLHIAAE